MGGKGAFGFWPDRFRTLVFMAIDNSHRVIMWENCVATFSVVYHPILFIRAGNDGMLETLEEFEIRRDSTTDCGVSDPLSSEKSP